MMERSIAMCGWEAALTGRAAQPPIARIIGIATAIAVRLKPRAQFNQSIMRLTPPPATFRPHDRRSKMHHMSDSPHKPFDPASVTRPDPALLNYYIIVAILTVFGFPFV